MYPRNAASPPRIAVGPVVQISDGAVQTTGVSVVVQPEGGAESAGGGTVAYSTAAGSVLYTPTQAETNYTAFVVTAYKAGCIPASTTIVTSANATAGKVQVGGMDADTVDASALAADAVTEIQNGLSTFDHTTHEVTTDDASRTASRATGFATPTNVSDAQTAIINAVNAVNTGAARYISIHTSAAYEIPDSGSVAYPIEIRTFDADGEPAAIDAGADPTVTVTRTTDSTDLSGNLAAFSSPATAVYRTTLTITQGTDSVAPLRIDASGAIATVTRSTSAYPVITDAVAVDFTSTDRANLAAILEDTGTTIPAQITLAQNDLDILTGTDGVTLATVQDNYTPAKAGDQMDLIDAPNATAVTAIQNGLALASKLLNYVRLLARKDSAVSTDLATELGEINADTGTGTGAYSNNDALESIRDNASGGDATLAKQEEILASLGLISGATGPGERQFDWNLQVDGNPAVGVKVFITTDSPYTAANTIAGPLYTNDSGDAPTMLLDDDTVYYGWRDSSRYNFTNPVQFRYSTANARWELWNGAAYEEWT